MKAFAMSSPQPAPAAAIEVSRHPAQRAPAARNDRDRGRRNGAPLVAPLMAPLVTPLLALALAGCAVGPDYRRPALDLPEQWAASAAPAEAAAAPATKPAATAPIAASAVDARWWSIYGDPTLDRLVDEALAHNGDAQIAAARVLEARAQAGIADADRWPAVTGSASQSRIQNSLVGATPLPPGTPRLASSSRVTLDASYEVDFWGRYRRASEAARADLLASEAARDALQLSLTALVVQQYYALLAADAQETAVRRVLVTRGETLELLRRRVAAGITSEFELHQAEAEEAVARVQLAAAVRRRETADAALAVLLGRSPKAVLAGRVERGRAAGEQLPARVDVPAGLPSALLLRRPDLREAEQRLIAANARIGETRAQLFPSIALTASLGSESADLGDLFTGPAGLFRLAAGLTQPIFQAGRLTRAEEATRAREAQARAAYVQAVGSAFSDVRQALAAQAAARDTLDAETRRAEALKLALAQAGQRYAGGIASRLDLLDVERNLLQAELARFDAEQAQQAAVADLFKALGGGWAGATPP